MLLSSLIRDPAAADLPLRGRALVSYELKLTLRPAEMTADDAQALRDSGLQDRAIHDVAAVVAYFNYVNRVALGLGVELER